jgi:2-oxoglutarate ferredoxin oxidoreductase subunit beta
MEVFEFFRQDSWPHLFCPGCGNGTVMNCFQRAFSELEMDLSKTAFVGGIGCSSRIPLYINSDAMHTTHGRAIAFATGLRLSRPDLKVVVFTGDGDLGAIGGNHFINGCRRNVDLTVICINNNIYGMTGGQASITTPHEFLSTTTPYGNKEYPFDLAEIAVAAGANYVARWTTRHVHELTKSIKAAIGKSGFSFVEAVSQCPTNFGRRNKMGEPTALLDWFKDSSIRRDKARAAAIDHVDLNLAGQITIGEFVNRDRDSYEKLIGVGNNGD